MRINFSIGDAFPRRGHFWPEVLSEVWDMYHPKEPFNIENTTTQIQGIHCFGLVCGGVHALYLVFHLKQNGLAKSSIDPPDLPPNE